MHEQLHVITLLYNGIINYAMLWFNHCFQLLLLAGHVKLMLSLSVLINSQTNMLMYITTRHSQLNLQTIG